MIETRTLRYYGYVKAPYEEVCALLRKRPLELLQQATTAASVHADEIVADLRVRAAGIEVGVDVRPHLKAIREEGGIAGLPPVTSLDVGWEATHAHALFPSMRLTLSATPSSSGETQIALSGEYQPPLGVVGQAIDAVVGHRIAEAAVHGLLDDIDSQLRRELSAGP